VGFFCHVEIQYHRGGFEMKYKTIRINENFNKVWIEELDGDRLEMETKPSGMGFYHYPETMPDEEALTELQQKLLRDGSDLISKKLMEIEEIKAKMVQLSMLKLPE
jgi:hypothetical protein